MTCLDDCCEKIKNLFEEHAGEDGELSKDELRKMIEEGVKNPKVKAKLTSENLDVVMGRMDKDKNGKVNFIEFCKFVAFAAKCQHKKCKD